MAKPKNCIILHGCEYDQSNAYKLTQRTPENHWTAWVRENVIMRGVASQTPLLPRSWAPDYDVFTAELEKYEITDRTVLVGHSCSCAFLVRWLGDTKRRIAKLILVAPWKVFDGTDSGRAAFYTYDIDPTIVNRVEKIVMFTADNESDDGKKSLKMFHDAIGGEIIALSGRGHYRTNQWSNSEFSELVDQILREN